MESALPKMFFGVTPDTSHFINYTFWDAVCYYDTEKMFSSTNEQRGLWIGLVLRFVNALNYWTLKENKTVLEWYTIQPADDSRNRNRCRSPQFSNYGRNTARKYRHETDHINLKTNGTAIIVQAITQYAEISSLDPYKRLGYTFVCSNDETNQCDEVKYFLEGKYNFMAEYVNRGEKLMNYTDFIKIFKYIYEDIQDVDIWQYHQPQETSI